MIGIMKVVSKKTEYQCLMCNKKYSTKEMAELCAAPREPKYNVGEWVMADEMMTMAVPGGDWFSREYEYIDEGSVGRISEITDENEHWGLDRAHPEYVYQFDKGDTPMTFYSLRESNLENIDEAALESIKERYNEKSRERDQLEDMLNEIGEENV